MLEQWEREWNISINPVKCQVLHVTRLKAPIPSKYFLHNIELESTPAAKYLGVTISDDLKWGKHIGNVTKKANQTLGFLKLNIKVHNQDLKSTTYKTLTRPQLKYASSVWTPHADQDIDIDKIESAQRRAARWATRDYRSTSSVTELLRNLGWRPLDQRRIDSRHKITYIVAIPLTKYLIPNRRESKFIHPLVYIQIPTATNFYKYSFFPRTVVHWNALSTSIVMHSSVILFAGWCMGLLNGQILF